MIKTNNTKRTGLEELAYSQAPLRRSSRRLTDAASLEGPANLLLGVLASNYR
jgi:hypothetical protein